MRATTLKECKIRGHQHPDALCDQPVWTAQVRARAEYPDMAIKFWLGNFPYGSEVENQSPDPNSPYGPADLAWSVGSHADLRVLKYCRTRGSKVIVPITEAQKELTTPSFPKWSPTLVLPRPDAA